VVAQLGASGLGGGRGHALFVVPEGQALIAGRGRPDPSIGGRLYRTAGEIVAVACSRGDRAAVGRACDRRDHPDAGSGVYTGSIPEVKRWRPLPRERSTRRNIDMPAPNRTRSGVLARLLRGRTSGASLRPFRWSLRRRTSTLDTFWTPATAPEITRQESYRLSWRTVMVRQPAAVRSALGECGARPQGSQRTGR
jgi:hypothetical protein